MPQPDLPAVFIEPLGAQHDLTTFSCGVEALDQYLRTQAGQDVRKHVAAAFVIVGEANTKVLGFYTLSAISIQLSDVPEPLTKKLPRYPLVPAILLGRLAVDRGQRGKGYGELLLIDALDRCVKTKEIRWAVVVVDAKDESAQLFSERYHFIRFSPTSSRLFLFRKTIETLLEM